MPVAVRVLHGNSASLASALTALTQADDVQATPSFGEAGEEEAEIQFISVRVDRSQDWEKAAALVKSLLPRETEYILTADG